MIFKKSIAIGLAAAALFASFGCGGGEKKTTTTPPAAETNQEKTTPQAKQQQPTVKNKLENIVLDVPHFNMPGGKANLFVNITNNNSEGVIIKEAIIAIEFKDSNGNFIWSGCTQFDNVNLYIPAGEERRHSFTILDSKCPRYDGYADYRYEYVFGK